MLPHRLNQEIDAPVFNECHMVVSWKGGINSENKRCMSVGSI
jgi:hypothetical protein